VTIGQLTTALYLPDAIPYRVDLIPYHHLGNV